MSKKYTGLKFFNTSNKEAVIEVYGIIGYEGWNKDEDENTTRQMSAELDRIKSLKADNITVKINSLGGDVNHALAIHDLLAEHPAEITTQINGLCASAATIIAMAGTRRTMSKNALYLIHKCSAYTGRMNENQLLAELESQKTVNSRILSLYKEKSQRDQKEIEDLFNYNNGQGKWLTAQEALDFGFITDIYNETQKVACTSKQTFFAFALPPLPDEYADFLLEDPELPKEHFWKEAPASFFDFLGNFFSKPTKQHSHTNELPMKNHFPFIFKALTLEDETTYNPDKGHLLTDKQLQDIEKQFKAFADLQEQNNTLKAESERLQSIIDKLPSEKVDVKGADPKTEKTETFADWQKQNAYYQSIQAEI